MANKSKKVKLPKVRDWNRVAIIERKKGAHIDRKKQVDKEKCRKPIEG